MLTPWSFNLVHKDSKMTKKLKSYPCLGCEHLKFLTFGTLLHKMKHPTTSLSIINQLFSTTFHSVVIFSVMTLRRLLPKVKSQNRSNQPKGLCFSKLILHVVLLLNLYHVSLTFLVLLFWTFLSYFSRPAFPDYKSSTKMPKK